MQCSSHFKRTLANVADVRVASRNPAPHSLSPLLVLHEKTEGVPIPVILLVGCPNWRDGVSLQDSFFNKETSSEMLIALEHRIRRASNWRFTHADGCSAAAQDK